MKNNNFTKEDIVKNITKKTGYPFKFTKKIIDDLLYILTLNIRDGGINLKNIGSFKLIKKKERIGRNPKTKEKYLISARKSLSFTASKNLLNIVNKK